MKKNNQFNDFHFNFTHSYLRFPHDPSSSNANDESDDNVAGSTSGNFENDRIMGIPNKDCDDGKVSEILNFIEIPLI